MIAYASTFGPDYCEGWHHGPWCAHRQHRYSGCITARPWRSVRVREMRRVNVLRNPPHRDPWWPHWLWWFERREPVTQIVESPRWVRWVLSVRAWLRVTT